MHCLNKHVGELIPVVAEIVSESVFPERELEIYVQNSKQKLQVNLQKCEFVASRLIDAALIDQILNELTYGIIRKSGNNCRIQAETPL